MNHYSYNSLLIAILSSQYCFYGLIPNCNKVIHVVLSFPWHYLPKLYFYFQGQDKAAFSQTFPNYSSPHRFLTFVFLEDFNQYNAVQHLIILCLTLFLIARQSYLLKQIVSSSEPEPHVLQFFPNPQSIWCSSCAQFLGWSQMEGQPKGLDWGGGMDMWAVTAEKKGAKKLLE